LCGGAAGTTDLLYSHPPHISAIYFSPEPQKPQQNRMSSPSTLQISCNPSKFIHLSNKNSWHSRYAQPAILKIEHKKAKPRTLLRCLCFLLLSI
jgi:hypothetical protein